MLPQHGSENSLPAIVERYSQVKANIAQGDMAGMGRVLKIEKELRERGRIPVALIDMTTSMVDDKSKVDPLVHKLKALGVPVFAFGDAAVGEKVIEVGVNGYLDGGGNGAETPFAALSSAMMFLGRPMGGLETKEKIVKALYGEPDKSGMYRGYAGMAARGESMVSFSPSHVQYSLDDRVKWSFGDAQKEMDTPEFKAIKTLVRMGLPLDILIITDEFGEGNLTPGFLRLIEPLLTQSGGSLTEFAQQHNKTRVYDSGYPWLEKMSELKGKKVHVTTITPESNSLGDYETRGLKHLYSYWQAFAGLFGGDAIKLDANMNDYKVEALIKAGRIAHDSVRYIASSLALLTDGNSATAA